MNPMLYISMWSAFVARTIVVGTALLLPTIILVFAASLFYLEGWISLNSGVLNFEVTINFLHDVIAPSLTTAGKLGLVAMLFGTVAAFGHWGPFWIIAIRDDSSLISQLWHIVSRATSFTTTAASILTTPPSTHSRGVAILARSLLLCSPSRVGLSTSAGLSGASPLRL